jgi:maleate cis-trans isomerase
MIGRDPLSSAPYGWRGRIGFIYPDSGRRDYDYIRLMPPGISAHIARIPFTGQGTLADIGAMSGTQNLVGAAEMLARLKPACISWADTSGSFMFGPRGDADQVKAMTAATGVPSSTTTTGLLAALRRLGIGRIAVAAPYLREVTDQLVSFLASHNVTVASLETLAYQLADDISTAPPAAVYALARKAFTPSVEALFIPCTDFEAINLIETLEGDLGVPVLTANQVTAWHAIRVAGFADPILGFGKLPKLSLEAAGS